MTGRIEANPAPPSEIVPCHWMRLETVEAMATVLEAADGVYLDGASSGFLSNDETQTASKRLTGDLPVIVRSSDHQVGRTFLRP